MRSNSTVSSNLFEQSALSQRFSCRIPSSGPWRQSKMVFTQFASNVDSTDGIVVPHTNCIEVAQKSPPRTPNRDPDFYAPPRPYHDRAARPLLNQGRRGLPLVVVCSQACRQHNARAQCLRHCRRNRVFKSQRQDLLMALLLTQYVRLNLLKRRCACVNPP